MPSGKRYNKVGYTLAAWLFTVAIAVLYYVPGQSDFTIYITGYSVAFLAYVSLVFGRITMIQLIILAILVRFIGLWSMPNMSDDIYRFIWDGRMIWSGIHPFAFVPSEVVGSHALLDQDLFDKLNSPAYYTIYPPIAQLFNYIAAASPSPAYTHEVLIYKALLFVVELGSIFLLYRAWRRGDLSVRQCALFLLNPLVLTEVMGNVHFEGVMIFFLLLFYYCYQLKKPVMSGIALACSIGAKLLPLLFVPLILIAFPSWRERARFILGLGVGLLVLFIPLIWSIGGDWPKLLESIALYVDKFEFNGSIYYALRALGYMLFGINMIHILGPALSILTVVGILYLTYRYAHQSASKWSILATYMLWTFMWFLILSRTVHPWYAIMPIFLGIWSYRMYPIVWSYLIGWTYINYSYPTYHENLWVVGVEYLVLAWVVFWEWKRA